MDSIHFCVSSRPHGRGDETAAPHQPSPAAPGRQEAAGRIPVTALVIGAAFLATPGAATGHGPQAGRVDDPQARHAQRLLTALRDVAGVPGLGAAVWKDGRLRWEGQAGLRDVDGGLPVQADTRFRLASVSKLFTATAAARLQEHGQLDVDGPLPWHPFPSGHVGAAITPRQLAAHLSGLPHYELGDIGRGGSAIVDSQAAARQWLRGRALQSAPGEVYRYSSWGYTLLGAAIESASGLPLQDYIATQLTAGLDIGPDGTDSGDTRAARPYEERAGRWRQAEPHDYSYSLGGAGLAATPGALATWGGRLLQGAVVKPATLAWMTAPSRLVNGHEARHGTAQVGFGWRIEADAQSRPVWHHAGAALGARSALVVRPGPVATSVALLSNAAWVASIVDSALTLTEVFTPPEQGHLTWVCPRLARFARVAWQGETLSAEVVSVQEDCSTLLRLRRSPKGWVTRELRLLPLRPGGDLHELALVTPIGLFVVRADERGALHGQVAGREWSVAFPAGAP
jgi:CubicO group peptidase (beta-lactamase class C family)